MHHLRTPTFFKKQQKKKAVEKIDASKSSPRRCDATRRTWTLVALRPATDAICWVAANIVLIDYMQKCAWMANFESFSKIYASESDSFFVFLRFFSPFVWLSFIHKNRPPSFQKKGLFAERASASEVDKTRGKKETRSEKPGFCYTSQHTQRQLYNERSRGRISRQRISTLIMWLKIITAKRYHLSSLTSLASKPLSYLTYAQTVSI